MGVTVPTVKSWLTLLETSGLIFFLTPYHRNFGKRIIKAPKCYFLDTGLVCYFVGLDDTAHALAGPMAGALFETACVAQLFKRLSVWGDERSMYYFRSVDGVEMDVVVEHAGLQYAMEIKLTSTIDPGRVRNMLKWMDVSRETLSDAFMISTSTNVGHVGRGVRNIHFSLL